MKFKLLKRKKNNVISNSNDNEKTREKFILKGWIESSRKATCTKNGTRGFLCRLYKLVLNGKMTFSCLTTCTDSYTRRENRCQIPFKTSLTPSKMDFSLGRSMVEMLGVLAIIGVLSIGGIQGYTIAMRHYRVNEIMNIATQFAVNEYTKCINYHLNEKEDSSDCYEMPDGNISCSFLCSSALLSKNNIFALPSGVKEILFNSNGISKTTKSGDIVTMSIDFLPQENELCHFMTTTFKSQGTNESTIDNCQGSYPYFVFYLMMN